MSCRECVHFDLRHTDKDGRQAGMCRAWGFSINEFDDRGCTRKRPMETEKCADAPAEGNRGDTYENTM